MLDKLKALDKLGISQTLIAQYCHCHKTMISKLIRGETHLTDKMAYLLEDGLNRLFNDIKTIMEGK